MLNPRHRAHGCGERGITMLEVTLSAALTLVVFGSVLALLDSFVKVESGFEERIDTRTDLNLITEEFARDVRSGGSPWAGTTSSEMASEVTIPRIDSSGELEVVHWSIDDEGTLERTVSNDSRPDAVRELATGLDTESSALSYYDSTGAELVPGVDSGGEISDCAARVGLALAAQDDSSFEASTSAKLRNATPAETC